MSKKNNNRDQLIKTSSILAAAVAIMPFGGSIARALTITNLINNTNGTAIKLTEAGENTLIIENGGTLNAGSSSYYYTGSGAVHVSGEAIDLIRIDNGGTLDVSGSSATGSDGFNAIYINNSTLSGGVSNSGSINADTVGDALLIKGGSTIQNISGKSDSIYNAGTINGSVNSAIVIDNSTLIGNINNEGTMEAGDAVIQLSNNAVIGGGIINSGTIETTGNSDNAISLSSSSEIKGTINNSGTIKGGQDGGYAFYLNNAVISGDIINSKNITADTAFRLENGAIISGDITNTGTIIGHSTNPGRGGKETHLSCTGFSLDGAGVDISGSITNSGSILTDEMAFNIVNGADISGGIINETSGVMQSNGTGSGHTYYANIYVGNADISGGVNNKGLIKANSSASHVVSVDSGAISGGITNTGTIDGSNVMGPAIYLNNITAATPININGGRIIGDVYDANYSSGNNYSPVTIGGTFESEGNFRSSSFTVNADGDFTFGDGQEVRTDDNAINEGIVRIEAGETGGFVGDFDNNGDFYIGKNASASMTGLYGTGDIHISVEDDGDNTFNVADVPNIVIDSGVLDDITLHVAVTGDLEVGGSTMLIDGDVGLSGDANITDDSSKYKFILSYSGNDVMLTVEESDGIEVKASTAAGQATAGVLQELIDLGGADAKLESVLNAAMDAADSEALDEVVKKLRRPVDGSTVAGGLAVSNKSASMAMGRLSSVRGGDTDVASADSFSLDSGVAAGNSYFFTPSVKSKHAWAQAFGQIATQDIRQGYEGYDANTYGMMFGIDSKEIIEDMTVGVAFSYGRTDVDSDSSNNTQIETDTYQLSLYGEKLLEDNFRIDGIVGYSFSQSDMSIYDIGGVPGVNANGEFDGQQVSAQVTLSKDLTTEYGFKLAPSISANYIYSDTEQYTDTGAGGASSTVDNEAQQLFEVGVGIEASKVYQISPCKCGTDWLKPLLRAGVRHDFIGDQMESSNQFVGGGSSFKTYGFTPAKTTYNIGFGFKRYSLEDWEATALYDFEFKQDYYSHNASFRVGRRF